MRLLIMASVSVDTVIWPLITSWTRSLSQSLPEVLSADLCPSRPSSTIRSSRLRLLTTVSAMGWASAAGWGSFIGFGSAGISGLLLLGSSNAGFRACLLQQFLTLNHFL